MRASSVDDALLRRPPSHDTAQPRFDVSVLGLERLKHLFPAIVPVFSDCHLDFVLYVCQDFFVPVIERALVVASGAVFSY